MTEHQLEELAIDIEKTGRGTIGDAQDVIFWMVCSGRFGPRSMEEGAKAAFKLMSVTGKSSKEAVAYIIGLTERSLSDPFALCPK
jgi:hypothetical protein